MSNQTSGWDAIVTRGTHTELATFLVHHWGGTENNVWDEGFYTYDHTECTWKQRTIDACKRDIQAFDGREFGHLHTRSDGSTTRKQISVNDSMCNSVLNLARQQISRRTFMHEPGFFDNAPFGVLCNGRFLCVVGSKIVERPCTPDDRQRVSLNITFTPNAPAPILYRSLGQWLGTDEDGMQKQELCAQFAGAALFGLTPTHQMALFLLGSGGNGKSQFLDMLSALFPGVFLAAVEPQKWSDPYFRDQLRGARLNIVHEIPSKTIAGSTEFKAIITGDPITARKIYNVPYKLRSRAAHIFSANALPGSTDITAGFWRRVMVLTMQRRFDRTSENIPELAKKIIAEELPGILAWAVAGAQSLLEQGHYTIPQSSIDAVQEWKNSCDPFGQWLNERVAPTRYSHEKAKSSVLFQDWKTWSEGELDPKSQRGFAVEMKKRSHKSKRTKSGVFFDLKIR